MHTRCIVVYTTKSQEVVERCTWITAEIEKTLQSGDENDSSDVYYREDQLG